MLFEEVHKLDESERLVRKTHRNGRQAGMHEQIESCAMYMISNGKGVD